MELPVHRLEPVPIDVGVVLGGLDRGVAQQLLHRPQVGPTGEQVRREAVPQRVRADRVRQPGPLAVLLDQRPEQDARQRPAGPCGIGMPPAR